MPTLYGGEDEPPMQLCDVFDASGKPSRVGHYLLLTKLGHGGMGVVFAAYDEKLDRKVAIKFLRQQLGPEGKRRLLREAQAMARISHPNVVQIHEIGDHRGLTFIVMQYLEGRTLRAWLSENKPDRAAILATMIAAGRGLAAAHARSVIHRDFKPDNVLVGAGGQVWVLDFGLAREAGGKVDPKELSVSELSSDLTRTGSVLGTPVYMSPEQISSALTSETHEQDETASTERSSARGRTSLGPASDQFSFCVVLWEALYDERPFSGISFERLAEAVKAGAKREPVRAREVPTWIRAILDRGLQVEPEQRWPSMDALLESLARDPTVRRLRRVLGFSSLAAIGLIVALGVGYRSAQRSELEADCVAAGQAIAADWNEARSAELEAGFAALELGFASAAWQQSRTPIDAYVDEWTEVRTELCRATELRGERTRAESEAIVACLDARRAGLAALLGAWDELDEQTLIGAPTAANALNAPHTCLEREWLEQALQPPAEIALQVHALRSRLEGTLALDRATKLAAAEREAASVLSEAEQLGWAPLVAEARLQLGRVQGSAGKYEDARATLVLASLEATGSAHDLVALDAATTLTGLIGSNLHDPERGRYWGDLATRYVERLELHGSTREAEELNNRAMLLSAAGEYDEALELYRAALGIREAKLGPEHPLTGQSLNNVGDVLQSLGEHDEALATQTRALEITRVTLGPEHPNVAFSLNNIANIQQGRGNYGEALRYVQESLRIREAGLGPTHPRLINALNNLGNTYWQLERYDEAIAAYERGIRITKAALGPEDPQVGLLMVGIGITRLAQGRSEEALVAHHRALALLEPKLGPNHPHISTMHVNIGDALLHLERYDEALLELQTALQIGETALSPEHETLGYSLQGLGIAYEGLGRLPEARAVLERGLRLREQASAAPKLRAEIRFVLGRVVWAMGEHASGRAQVETARDEFRSTEGQPQGLAEVDAWLAEHPP